MSGQLVGVEHAGMAINNVGILNRIGFEKSSLSLIRAAKQAKLAIINDPTAAQIVNNLIPDGTGSFELYAKEY